MKSFVFWNADFSPQFGKKRTEVRAPFVIILFLLSSCARAGEVGGFTPTPVVAAVAADQPPVKFDAAQTPSPVPFQFNLPTPGAEPISGWRPPLYPVPWAMSPYDHFYFARPIAADNVNWPLAEYRYGGVFFAPNIVHTGVDIDAEMNAPILAAGPGTVISSDWGLYTEAPGNQSDPYGMAVVVRHDFGYKDQALYTVYAHMSKLIAVVGQHVGTGDVLGLVGDTGATTGPHLHFEIRLGRNAFYNTFNPELWMAPPQGWGVLVGRVTDEDDKLLTHIRVEVRPMPYELPVRTVRTYGIGAVNSDPYYQENMVLSDLPAGLYKVTLIYEDKEQQTWVEIFPGQVSYLTFAGTNGFNAIRPSAPTLEFVPETLPSTPTSLP
ncbi:MAG: M23 family metallopeptidase [Chloroflexi bacterium]|nr:M23 family metallopeptidase [Chloroflexota bacterium]